MKPHPVHATKTDVMQQAFYPVAAVGVYHLAVFGHDNVRGFVAILPPCSSRAGRKAFRSGVLGEGTLPNTFFALRVQANTLRWPTDLYWR